MGAAKLAIKTKYQPDNKENDEEKDQSDHQGLPDLIPDHFGPATVSGGICDLIDLKSVEEFTVLFLHLQVAQLVVDKKGIVPGCQDIEIDHDYPGIAIDQQMTGGIAMKEAYLMPIAIIPDIGPGHLTHTGTRMGSRKV